MSKRIGLGRKFVDVLILVAGGVGTPLDVSRRLKVSVSVAREMLEELRRLGLVYVDETGAYRMQELISSALIRLAAKYPLKDILSGSTPVILEAMINPASATEIIERTGFAKETVYRVLRRLPQIIRRTGRGYQLIDDPILKYIVIQFAKIARKSAIEFEEILRLDGYSLVRVDKPLSEREGEPTAFTAFGKYGVELIGGKEYYYVVPPRKVSPEEVLLHALKVSRSPDDRTKTALLYAKLQLEKKIDEGRLSVLASRLDPSGELRRTLYDLDRYVQGLSPDRPELFLPRRELLEYAEAYGVDVKALEPAPISEEMFRGLGQRLDRRVEVYLFGGAAMMMKGYKAATKDVDLVVKAVEDADALDKALRSMGYSLEEGIDVNSLRRGVPRVYVAEGKPKIEIFLGRIFDKAVVTGSMLNDAETREYGNLTVRVASDEDIVFLKLLTERLRDLTDVELIIRGRKKPLDWGKIYERVIEQEKITGRHIALTVFDGVRDLVEVKGLIISSSIMRKLRTLAEKQLIKYAVEKLRTLDPRKISEMTGIPENRVRKIIHN